MRRLTSGEQGGYGLDAGWNDDFHHVARVAATGHAEYYFGDYQGTPQEFISLVKWGYLYQGQWNQRQQEVPRLPGARSATARNSSIFLQNHDQVGNSPRSRRIHELTSPGRHRALTALLLLAPGTPLLFQGQEFASLEPVLFLCRSRAGSGQRWCARGGTNFMRNFRRQAGSDAERVLADPGDPRHVRAVEARSGRTRRNTAAYRAAPRPAAAAARRPRVRRPACRPDPRRGDCRRRRFCCAFWRGGRRPSGAGQPGPRSGLEADDRAAAGAAAGAAVAAVVVERRSALRRPGHAAAGRRALVLAGACGGGVRRPARARRSSGSSSA